MFKIGDEVVYHKYHHTLSIGCGLKLGELYTIQNIFTNQTMTTNWNSNWLYINFDSKVYGERITGPFNVEYFISLIELRKLKLEKICSKLETK